MKAKNVCILVTIELFLIGIPYRNCLASNTSPNRFHSQLNGYSVIIPQGWRQVPEKVIRQEFEALLSENKLTFDIETILAIEFEETGLQYPYAVIQVTRYSKYGVNKPLKKEEIKKIFRVTTKTLRLESTEVEDMDGKLSESLRGIVSQIEWGKIYIDNENMSYLLGADMEMVNVGKVKSLLLVNFGRYAFVKIRFICLESDWYRFGNDRDLILNSFKFDPLPDYKSESQNKSFWEDSLVDVAVYGTVALFLFLITVIVGVFKSKEKDDNSHEQGKDGIEIDEQKQ